MIVVEETYNTREHKLYVHHKIEYSYNYNKIKMDIAAFVEKKIEYKKNIGHCNK